MAHAKSRLSPLNQRRWRNFRRNGRAFWSLILFCVLFGLSLFAEVLANDKPILVSYRGEWYAPIVKFYPETTFGGDFRTEAPYGDIEVQCLIKTGGLEACWDNPEDVIAKAASGSFEGAPVAAGWLLWPPSLTPTPPLSTPAARCHLPRPARTCWAPMTRRAMF